tara:strand:- start:7269 stop:7946 length:678 start_codon:yes stop_codon:yes gene_type:complete
MDLFKYIKKLIKKYYNKSNLIILTSFIIIIVNLLIIYTHTDFYYDSDLDPDLDSDLDFDLNTDVDLNHNNFFETEFKVNPNFNYRLIEGFDTKAENDLDWVELLPDRRDAWELLGWTQITWDKDDGNSCTPCLSKKKMKKLKKKQKKADNKARKAANRAAAPTDEQGEIDRKESIKKYEKKKKEVYKKYGRGNDKAKKAIKKWIEKQKKNARNAGGGFVRGKYFK